MQNDDHPYPTPLLPLHPYFPYTLTSPTPYTLTSPTPFTLTYPYSIDEAGALLHKLGTSNTASTFGAVSALSLNKDCTRVLVGHAHGQVSFLFSISSLLWPL